MTSTEIQVETVLCPECKGRGMIRPAGEWANETCPTCDGRGEVACSVLGPSPDGADGACQ